MHALHQRRRSSFAPELLLAARGARRRACARRSSTSTACSPTAGCTSASRARAFKALPHARRPRPEAAAAGGITPVVVTGRDSPALRGRRRRPGHRPRRITAPPTSCRRGASAAGALGPGLGRRRRDRRRLARPAAAARAALRLRAAQRARRGEGGGAPRHRGRRRPRRGARVLRPAAGGRGPLRRAAGGLRVTRCDAPAARPMSPSPCRSPGSAPSRRRGAAARRPARRVSAYLPLLLMAAAGAGHLVAGAQHADARARPRRRGRRATSPTT